MTDRRLLVGLAVSALLLVVQAVIWTVDGVTVQASPGTMVECNLDIGEKATAEDFDKALIYLPKEYTANAEKRRWPLVLFLHGRWHRGSDLALVRTSGIPKLIDDGAHFPFIVVAPQCNPENIWNTEALLRLVEHVQGKFNVDQDRIYVSGFEIGGYATWELAATNPDRFAAIVPFSGYPQFKPPLSQWLSRMHCWAFIDQNDRNSSYSELYSYEFPAHWKNGGDARLTKLAPQDQSLSEKWTEVYERANVFEWMLQKKRRALLRSDWKDGLPKPGTLAAGTLGELTSYDQERDILEYDLLLPQEYSARSDSAWPLVLFLNDGKRSGADDRESLIAALPKAMASAGEDRASIFVAPKCPSDGEWNPAEVSELLEYLHAEYAVDPERIYLIGAGSGATGIWKLALRAPLNFAAMAMLSFNPPRNSAHESHALITIPKWYFSKAEEDAELKRHVAYEETATAIIGDGWRALETPKLTSLEQETESLNPSRANELFDWLLEKSVDMQDRYDRWPGNYVGFNRVVSPEVASLFASKKHPIAGTGSESHEVAYQLFSPKNVQAGVKYPLLIWMHGHGRAELELEAGQLLYMDLAIRDPSKPDEYPFYIVAMQCPKDRSWFEDSTGSAGNESRTDEPIGVVMEIVGGLCRDYPIDRDRIAMTGISSGATACWEIISRHPGFLSAIAPISSFPQNRNNDVDLNGTAVWAFNPLVDRSAPLSAVHHALESGRRHGAVNVRLTSVPFDHHHCWYDAYLDYDLLEWLVSQRRED